MNDTQKAILTIITGGKAAVKTNDLPAIKTAFEKSGMELFVVINGEDATAEMRRPATQNKTAASV